MNHLKRKKKKHVGGVRVVNENRVQEWKLCPGESFNTVFKHRVIDGPMFSIGCKGCHKWHNKGFCFDDCPNEKSHTDLNEEYSTTFGQYIKTCRGE